jgi:hypothetical protein
MKEIEMITIDNIKTATADQLDEIIERTDYCESGVALGGAAEDQDLRRAAQRELGRRMGYDD